MKKTFVRTVAVLGAGTMGQGIARVSAMAGFRTLLYDISSELVRKGMAIVKKSLEKDMEKGKLSAEQRLEIEKNIFPCSAVDELKADLVIEAVVEDLAVKQSLFRQIEKVNASADPTPGKGTVLATNTSSLSVTQIASVLTDPSRCVGLHFFNPVPQ